MKLEKIYFYPGRLKLITTEGLYWLDYDQQQGEFTRQEWKDNDEIVYLFDAEDQENILDALSNTSNVPFFREF